MAQVEAQVLGGLLAIDADADYGKMFLPTKAVEFTQQDRISIQEKGFGRRLLREPNEVGPFGRRAVGDNPTQVDDGLDVGYRIVGMAVIKAVGRSELVELEVRPAVGLRWNDQAA